MSSAAPTTSPPARSDLDSRSSRREMFWFAVPIAAVFMLVGLLGIAVLFGEIGGSRCTPPTQGELRVQQRFVVAHLPDARQLEREAADCDDGGVGWVTFTTKLTPSGARDAFVADGSCSVVNPPEGATSAAVCPSGRFTVTMLFAPLDGRDSTSGELTMDPM